MSGVRGHAFASTFEGRGLDNVKSENSHLIVGFMVIPASMISLLPVVDVTANKPFKESLSPQVTNGCSIETVC
jgi:hypothetical protein